jgi:hypothetical protein
MKPFSWFTLLAALALAILCGPPRAGAQDAPAGPDEFARMVARIDTLVNERLARAGVEPAPLADDAEFLRRAHLDLIGVIPTAAEVRAFLADTTPDKRARLIESLLARPGHATHLAGAWRDVLLPPDPNVAQFGSRTGFQFWLRDRFERNVRYDRIVAELLITRGNPNQATPALFFTAAELKPEELAARSARIFLGVQIECAQCHDHPTDRWTKRDFWGYAAFFAQLESVAERPLGASAFQDKEQGEVFLPGTQEAIPPTFLGRVNAGAEPGQRRLRLALWLASKDNPYFARATANRVWALLFGRGLVEPRDDLGPHNPPSHPELLDELSQYLIKSRFDLRLMLRTLASTDAYARSSAWPSDGPEPAPELFARMAMKSLSPEQLYDCLAAATRRQSMPLAREGEFDVDAGRQAFLAKFEGTPASAVDFSSGIPQALTLMNGDEIRAATDLESSGLLVALGAPFLTDAERVESMFLATLSRKPTDAERSRFLEYVSRKGAKERSRGLSDALWAILNSAEFALNH